MKSMFAYQNLKYVPRGTFAVAVAVIFAIVLVSVSPVLAAPFAPGETLDPGCTPGASNCKVLQLNAATSTATFGVGTTTPWARFSVAGVAGTSTTPLFTISSSTIGATTTIFHITASGNIGLATSSPYARLSVAGEAVFTNLSATSTTATSTIAGGLNVGSGAFVYDFSSGITSADSLRLGSVNFESDAGIVSWADLAVTSSAAVNTVESYTAQIDGIPVLTVYGEADGSGGVQNLRVGIGTTSPYAKLSVVGETVSRFFTATTTTATSTFAGSFAVGTSTLTVPNARFVVGTATTTNLFVDINSGKIGIGTSNPTAGPLEAASGAFLTVGGVWTNASSRTLKSNFTSVNSEEILRKINSLSITEWNYKLESPGVKHIGPIAEEFFEIFGLGGGDSQRSISTIDPAGVALVGIQALTKRLDNLNGGSSSSVLANILSGLEALGAKISNGIAQFRKIVADAVKTDTLCLQDVCVSRDQLKELLDKNGIAAVTSPDFQIVGPSLLVSTSTSSASSDTESPVISIVGANPAKIKVGDRYSDLGATVSDNVSLNLGVEISGAEIDTTEVSNHTVIYTASDQAGNRATSTREVIVESRYPEADSNQTPVDNTATSTSAGSDS